MPVRVRCRCGQELVLRYGEWVYVFLGLSLLCLILNSVALLLLYLRLEEVSRLAPQERGAPGASRDPSSSVAQPFLRDRDPQKNEKDAGGDPAAEHPEPRTKAPIPGPLRIDNPQVPKAPDAESQAEKQEGAKPRASLDPAHGYPASGEGSTGMRSLTFREPIPTVADAIILPRRSVSPSAAPWTTQRPEAGRKALDLPWIDEPVLLRFLLLEKEKDDLLFPLAFLSDPDPRIQKGALGWVLSRPIPSSGVATGRPEVSALLRRSSPKLRESGQGRRLLEAFGLPTEDAGSFSTRTGGVEGSLESVDKVEKEILTLLKERTASHLASPAARSLHEQCAMLSTSGMDVVLLVDVSRSMEWGLEGIQRESTWLFSAALWAIPGLRVGLVLYRDNVEALAGFTAFPGGDLLQLLRDTRAEGGGDVPEGVHHAIKAALSLGRFDWRSAAQKHIVLLGDAAPPYEEIQPLLTLAAQAFHQGGYRLHALSLRPDEGRSAVASFPELAREGGGRAATVTELADLGMEIFLSLFSKDAEPALRPLLPSLRLAFSPEN